MQPFLFWFDNQCNLWWQITRFGPEGVFWGSKQDRRTRLRFWQRYLFYKTSVNFIFYQTLKAFWYKLCRNAPWSLASGWGWGAEPAASFISSNVQLFLTTIKDRGAWPAVLRARSCASTLLLLYNLQTLWRQVLCQNLIVKNNIHFIFPDILSELNFLIRNFP